MKTAPLVNPASHKYSELRRKASAAYVRRGWPVFPCHGIVEGRCTCGARDCASPGKHPLTPNGHHDATIDLDVIRGWFRQWSDCNVALACTSDSALLVVDLDGDDARQRFEQLARQNGGLPDTLRQRTGRGDGWHIVFQHPGGPLVGKLWRDVDIKHSGYIVASPSRHISGRRYRWLNWPARPTPLPPWLLQLLRPKRRSSSKPKELNGWEAFVVRARLPKLLRFVEEAEEGERNRKLYWAACRAAELIEAGALDEEVAGDALMEAAETCGFDDSFTPHGAYQTIESAFRTIKGER